MKRWVCAWGAVHAGCADTLSDNSFRVEGPRILAIAADPAEAAPGAAVRLEALAVDADGPTETADIAWSLCLARKPLAELGPVSPDCLDGDDAGTAPLGAGASTEMDMPLDVCSRFGPNPPLPSDGSPAGRPVDPDPTGGFHQPLLAWAAETDTWTLGSVRARCGLANVAQETFVAWNKAYRNNTAPRVSNWTLDEVPWENGAVVSAGATVTLAVGWPTCAASTRCGDGVCGLDEDLQTCAEDCADPEGCAGAETYVRYDEASTTFEHRVERLSVTWFTTAGTLETARNGVVDGREDTLTNRFIAPTTPGPVWIWAVLRDERGGVGFEGRALEVVP